MLTVAPNQRLALCSDQDRYRARIELDRIHPWEHRKYHNARDRQHQPLSKGCMPPGWEATWRGRVGWADGDRTDDGECRRALRPRQQRCSGRVRHEAIPPLLRRPIVLEYIQTPRLLNLETRWKDLQSADRGPTLTTDKDAIAGSDEYVTFGLGVPPRRAPGTIDGRKPRSPRRHPNSLPVEDFDVQHIGCRRPVFSARNDCRMGCRGGSVDREKTSPSAPSRPSPFP